MNPYDFLVSPAKYMKTEELRTVLLEHGHTESTAQQYFDNNTITGYGYSFLKTTFLWNNRDERRNFRIDVDGSDWLSITWQARSKIAPYWKWCCVRISKGNLVKA